MKGCKFIVALGVTALSLEACATASAFEQPRGTPPPALGVVPFELHNAHVYVRVQVGDSVSGWFLLDSGASTTLDSATAYSVGWRASGGESAFGGGEAVVTVRYARDIRLGLLDSTGGQVGRVPPRTVAVLDLSAVSRGEGRPVAGVLGGSFFSRYAVLIDYERRVVEVHGRGSFRGPAGWVATPLRVRGDLVSVRGAVTLRPAEAPIEGWYHLDTGGGHALILNAGFVSRHGLATADTAVAEAMQGVGGGTRARPGRVTAFQFGGATLADVSTLFSHARAGFFARDDLDGSVGGGILAHFSGVALDYSAKRLWLGPMRGSR